MENNITVNIENLSEDERNILLGLIEKANKPKRKSWKPQKDEKYWFIRIGVENFITSNDSYDKFLYSIGNCFKTKEETEFTIEKLKVVAELKRFAEENNEYEIDWENLQQRKYSICFDYDRHILDVTHWYLNKYGNVTYFSSEEIARQGIKTIGEDRLKKYYFEVED